MSNLYYASTRLLAYGKTGYSIKIKGDEKNTLCNICGEGEEARIKAEHVAAALNAYGGADYLNKRFAS